MMERARKGEGIEQQKTWAMKTCEAMIYSPSLDRLSAERCLFAAAATAYSIIILLNEWAVVAGNFQLDYSTTVHDASGRASKLVSRRKAASPQVANYGGHSFWAPVSPQISLLSSSLLQV